MSIILYYDDEMKGAFDEENLSIITSDKNLQAISKAMSDK